MAKSIVEPAGQRRLDPKDLHGLVTEAFDSLGEANPLRKMSAEDRKLVWEMLMLFADRGRPVPHFDQLDRITKVARDAAKLAAQIEETFGNDYGALLNFQLSEFHDLPGRLNFFAAQAAGLPNTLGDTGLKMRRTLEDRYLIYACELVKLKTGSWNDEHVAELLQTMQPESSDFSGDAIRKTRKRFEEKHPLLYGKTMLDVSIGRRRF